MNFCKMCGTSLVQKAAASGVTIGFWDYFRVGAPLTIVTLAIGILWLW